jgi:dolichol kinase
MLAVFVCLAGILTILLIAELLWHLEILHNEYHRKFVHILSAGFIAAWPWLVSFKTIQLIGAAMVVVVLLNRRIKRLHYLGNHRYENYGDVFLALAVIVCALLTQDKVFFATAMAEVAFADGLVAIIGKEFGGRWSYNVFQHSKTVIGSMAFWLISLAVIGTGMLFAHDLISSGHYALMLLLLPPLLTLIENSAVLGLDNLAVPVAVIIALQIVART